MRYFRIALWFSLMCACFLWQFPFEKEETGILHNCVIEYFLAVIPEPEETLEPEEIEEIIEPVMLEKYRDLYEQNNDLIGFLYLTEEYQYPVLQRIDDQNFYEDHGFFREEDKKGSIFANRYSKLGEPGISLLYGHSMKSGEMFGSLKRYQYADYFEEHNVITLDTLYEEMSYEVVAVALTSLHEDFKYYDYLGVLNESDFEMWKEGLAKYVIRGTLDELEHGDTICEMTCCAYHVKDGRWVIVLKAMD